MSGFLVLLSPAKSLRGFAEFPVIGHTMPRLLDKSKVLISSLKRKSKSELSKMMGLSENLTSLNLDRYKSWSFEHDVQNSLPAMFTFDGDVYKSLDIDSLSPPDVLFAQDHIRILSGLYGILRPLDLIQPHRLEMGTKLKTRGNNDLYSFWNKSISTILREDLTNHNLDLIVNLASQEYFESVKGIDKKIKVVTIDFKESKNGSYQTIGIFAKQARGLMARYIVQNRITKTEDLFAFHLNSYKLNEKLSLENKLVFTRNIKD